MTNAEIRIMENYPLPDQTSGERLGVSPPVQLRPIDDSFQNTHQAVANGFFEMAQVTVKQTKFFDKCRDPWIDELRLSASSHRHNPAPLHHQSPAEASANTREVEALLVILRSAHLTRLRSMTLRSTANIP